MSEVAAARRRLLEEQRAQAERALEEAQRRLILAQKRADDLRYDRDHAQRRLYIALGELAEIDVLSAKG